jgi:putative transposase
MIGKYMALNNNDEKNGNFYDVSGDSTLLYDSYSDRFTLFIPKKIQKDETAQEIQKDENIQKKSTHVSLDPGIVEFLTGYASNHVIEIGKNLKDTISKYLDQIEEINKSKISSGTKSKAIHKRYTKIHNLVDDLHWKAIKYITTNYTNILIGNMSTKSICEGNLNDRCKNVALLMRLYVFKERLKYKCYLRGNTYKSVDECYTSMMCTNCGRLNRKLGSQRVFLCPYCHYKVGRDIGAGEKIYIKSIIE